MERQFNWPEQESLQLCDCVTSTGRRRKWTGGTEVRLANTSSKALRGEERDEKRGEESQEDAHRNENRWKEMTGGEKSLEELRCGFTICNKRSEVPEKSMEVCRSSYRQTLFLEPIALHFLNLETSATRLAGVLLVHALYTIQWYLSIYIFISSYIYIFEFGQKSGTAKANQTVELKGGSKPWNHIHHEWYCMNGKTRNSLERPSKVSLQQMGLLGRRHQSLQCCLAKTWWCRGWWRMN